MEWNEMDKDELLRALAEMHMSDNDVCGDIARRALHLLDGTPMYKTWEGATYRSDDGGVTWSIEEKA